MAMTSTLRIREFRNGSFTPPGVGEEYLIASLLMYEISGFKNVNIRMPDDPLLYFVSLAEHFSEYQSRNSGISVFRDRNEQSVLFVKDINDRNPSQIEYELLRSLHGISIRVKAQKDGMVVLYIPSKIWGKQK